MYEEVHVGRLYEKIVQQIEKRIVDGDLKSGDKLPSERELGNQFGVSRTSVREAMKALSLKGLIEVMPGKGTFITDQTSKALRHSLNLMVQIGKQETSKSLIELREILEPEIAAISAARAKEDNVAAMQEAIDTMDSALEDVGTYIEADLDFHLALAEGTQNPLILLLIDILIVELREQRFRSASVDGSLYRGQPHHKAILAAVKNRDSESARRLMIAHMVQVRDDIETALALES